MPQESVNTMPDLEEMFNMQLNSISYHLLKSNSLVCQGLCGFIGSVFAWYA